MPATTAAREDRIEMRATMKEKRLPGFTSIGRRPAAAMAGGRPFASAAASLWCHGYARLPGTLPPDLCRQLAARLAALQRRGAPPVAVFADPGTWRAARHCLPFARYMLGPDCRMLPHLWAMALHPGGGGRGWPPHADYQGASVTAGPVPMAISLSFWLALSDTGPENACMHVLPRSGGGGGAIALPAKAGDALVWRQDLLHWGGRMTRRARGPRLSLALEFQNTAFAALSDPLLDPERPPPAGERVRLVDRQRAKYRHLAPPPRRGRTEPVDGPVAGPVAGPVDGQPSLGR